MSCRSCCRIWWELAASPSWCIEQAPWCCGRQCIGHPEWVRGKQDNLGSVLSVASEHVQDQIHAQGGELGKCIGLIRRNLGLQVLEPHASESIGHFQSAVLVRKKKLLSCLLQVS
jgi:hypothetical protein